MSNNKVSFATDEALNQTMTQLDQRKIQQFMDLEGQCKIQKIVLLKINIFKLIFLNLLCIASVIGLLMLVWFKWFRVKVWFSQCPIHEASYAYIIGGGGNQDIENVTQLENGISFYFKKLEYKMKGNKYTPIGFDFEENFSIFSSQSHLKRGLDQLTVQTYRAQYGKNEHPVEIPNYFSFMFDILLKPFFLLQYIVCIAFFVEGLTLFAVLNLVFSIITTTINYILTYLSYRKIKDMAEKMINVRVFRDKKFIEIPSNMVVPGDLIDPQGEIMCDCILIKGQIYVNQASLTGQSMPIGKFPATKIQHTTEDNRWLFEGSKVVEKKDVVYALVVHTGYATKRGRIIRKILTRIPTKSQIFSSALYFLLEAFAVAMIIYFATIAYLKEKNISDTVVGFRFVDFLGWSFPPTFPIYFNVAYSFAVVRLKRNQIICIQSQKTVQACNLKVMCFDKTGTLTQNTVEVHQVLKIKDQNNIIDITEQVDSQEYEFVWKLFATCHTTKKIEGVFMGDEVDLRMFLFSKYQMADSKKEEVKFQAIKESKKQKLQVLRINQFESKFQSMSVLVRDLENNKIYAFLKGAPQRIERNSILKVNNYEKTVASLSLGGYRTIGYGYREVPHDEVKNYLEGPRDIFEKQITALGLVAFENKLKHDTRQTIDRLVYAGIQPKIITGDNIFIAVQTGVRAGVISAHDKVILLQGRKQPKQQFQPGIPRKFKATLLSRHSNQTTQQTIYLDEDGDYLNQPYPIAIDNDFLKLDPSPQITTNMKLFARISPENKALVVVKFKQAIQAEYMKRSFISRLCGQLKTKVGMCGDGANDLMAIRSADVGIGINDSDASYGATFAIVNMLEVDQIVRDGKATTINLVQMIRYYQFISFLKIPASLLMILDSAYFNEAQLTFFNFTSTVIYPIFLAMSRPSKNVTKAVPNGNLFGPMNHFRFWGSLIIATGGLIGGYFYYTTTEQYKSNLNPIVINKWNPLTYSATIMFLLVLPPFAIYSLFFYIGQPWKEKIYKNWILFLLIVLNLMSTVVLHYITKYAIKALGVYPISFEKASIVLLISIAACLLGFGYNQMITQISVQCFDDQKQGKDKK